MQIKSLCYSPALPSEMDLDLTKKESLVKKIYQVILWIFRTIKEFFFPTHFRIIYGGKDKVFSLVSGSTSFLLNREKEDSDSFALFVEEGLARIVLTRSLEKSFTCFKKFLQLNSSDLILYQCCLFNLLLKKYGPLPIFSLCMDELQMDLLKRPELEIHCADWLACINASEARLAFHSQEFFVQLVCSIASSSTLFLAQEVSFAARRKLLWQASTAFAFCRDLAKTPSLWIDLPKEASFKKEMDSLEGVVKKTLLRKLLYSEMAHSDRVWIFHFFGDLVMESCLVEKEKGDFFYKADSLIEFLDEKVLLSLFSFLIEQRERGHFLRWISKNPEIAFLGAKALLQEPFETIETFAPLFSTLMEQKKNAFQTSGDLNKRLRIKLSDFGFILLRLVVHVESTKSGAEKLNHFLSHISFKRELLASRALENLVLDGSFLTYCLYEYASPLSRGDCLSSLLLPFTRADCVFACEDSLERVFLIEQRLNWILAKKLPIHLDAASLFLRIDSPLLRKENFPSRLKEVWMHSEIQIFYPLFLIPTLLGLFFLDSIEEDPEKTFEAIYNSLITVFCKSRFSFEKEEQEQLFLDSVKRITTLDLSLHFFPFDSYKARDLLFISLLLVKSVSILKEQAGKSKKRTAVDELMRKIAENLSEVKEINKDLPQGEEEMDSSDCFLIAVRLLKKSLSKGEEKSIRILLETKQEEMPLIKSFLLHFDRSFFEKRQ